MRNKIIMTLAISIASVSYGLEPLKDSTDIYMGKMFSHIDKNNDGLFKAEDNPGDWKKKKGLDTNKDGAVDLSEFKAKSLKYIDSPGKQIRNVMFKKSPTGDVYLDFYFP